jgi:hypothetical protein
MPTNLPLRTNGTAGFASRLEGWLLAGYCVSLVVLCSLLVVNGPQLRAAADAREAQVTEDENKAFCSLFGIGPETGRYAQCARELEQIRTRYLQRHFSESIL